MTDISAVIIAAGRGVRMGARGEMTPKGMIALDGVPLVRASVLHLASRGIGSVRIVTGHLAEKYESEFSGTPGVDLIHNPDFHNSGSLRSLACGLEGLSGPVMILESDIMYEPRALDPLIAGPSGLVLSGPTNATDEVYVWTGEGNQLLDMSKDPDHRDEAHLGELVGISKVGGDQIGAYQDRIARMLIETPKTDYESSVVAHAGAHPFRATLIEDLVWAEVDDEEMLATAYENVWPRASAELAGLNRARAV